MDTPRTQSSKWLCAAAAGIFALAAWATGWADGELDTSFGTNGAVRITFPNSSRGYLYDSAVVNGAIEAAGFERVESATGCTTQFPNLFVVHLSLAGTVIGSPHSYAQQAIKCPAGLVVDAATGDIYVAGYDFNGSSHAAAARFSASGTVIATYTDPSSGATGWSVCKGAKVLLDNQGRFVAPCYINKGFGFRQLAVLRLSTQDNQLVGDSTFGGDGSVVFRLPGSITSSNVITQDAGSGSYYVGGAACGLGDSLCPSGSNAQLVIRLDSVSGSLDTNYGSGGLAVVFSAPGGEVKGITLDNSGNSLIGGGYGDTTSGYVARVTPAGTPDATFGANGVVRNVGDHIVDVRTDFSNRVYALGSGSQLMRLKVDGTRDASFASSSDVRTLNGPGSAWQSMQFVDDTHSSVYLVGGADGSSVATTAVIAKVRLDWTASTPEITTTLLESSATTIVSGQSVTLTATVSGNSPTGAVTFRDGSMTLGSPVALNSGSASYTTSALAIGSHSITAGYGGDKNNAPSTSAMLTETVDAAPVIDEPTNGSGRNGGGSMTLLDMCVALLLALYRANERRTERQVFRPRQGPGAVLEDLSQAGWSSNGGTRGGSEMRGSRQRRRCAGARIP